MRQFALPFVFLFSLVAGLAHGIDAIAIGGQVGNVGLSGATAPAYSNALGFAVDLSLRTTSQIDLVFLLQQSSHTSATNPTLLQWTGGFSADVHVARISDFDFSLGLGPALVAFQGGSPVTRFGIHGGAAADLWIEDRLRLGIGFRYYGVLNGSITGDSFWLASMRIGYRFEV